MPKEQQLDGLWKKIIKFCVEQDLNKNDKEKRGVVFYYFAF